MQPYKPPYKITDKILDLYGKINESLGVCKNLYLVKPQARLRKQNRIKTIQSSLAIEGNTLEIEQVTALIEKSRVIGPQKDILEVQNAIAAYEFIQSYNPYKIKDFLKAHQVLMQGLIHSAGSFRTSAVGILKGSEVTHIAPKHTFVSALMKDLFDYLKNDSDVALIKSCVFHYETEFIHPFADGNGRIGRFWQTRLLMNVNPIFEFVPIEKGIKDNQEKYYKTLSVCDKTGSSTAFIEFMLETIYITLKETIDESRGTNGGYKIRSDYALIELHDWFDRKEYMTVCKGISTATASRDLKQMLDEKILISSGSKRMTKYKKNTTR